MPEPKQFYGRYHRVNTQIWTDPAFAGLPPVLPSARYLYFWLLAGQEATNIPGVVIAGPMAVAEILDWEVHETKAAFQALVDAGLVLMDAKAQLLDDGLIPDVEPVGAPPVVPDWAHLGVPPLTIKATRLGLAVCGIDVPLHPIPGLKRGVIASGVFEAEITPTGVDLNWAEVLQEDLLAFNLRPKTRAEGESMAASFCQMADALVAAGDLAEYRRDVPDDRICSGCGTRPVRPSWECDPRVIRDHRDHHLCPVCSATAGIGEVLPKIRQASAAFWESMNSMDLDDLMDMIR